MPVRGARGPRRALVVGVTCTAMAIVGAATSAVAEPLVRPLDFVVEDDAEHRLVLELTLGGDSPGPSSLRSVGDAVWANQPLSAWWGLRGGLLRTESWGLTWGGDLGVGLNREDSGNALVGEIRHRTELNARGLVGYRLGLAGAWLTPYGWGGANAYAGVKALGVLDDSRLSPLFGGGGRAGLGVMIEVWRLSVRFDAGLGLGLSGLGSFGAAALGFVL